MTAGDNITIVKMRERHIGQIAGLEKMTFSQPWTEPQIREELDNSSAIFLAAEAPDGAVAGYIGAHIAAEWVYIANIAVDPKYRRRGIGSRLLRSLEDAVRGKNAEFITLEVRKSNSAAQQMYKKSGFELCGERRRFYQNPTEDAQIFTLSLKKHRIEADL